MKISESKKAKVGRPSKVAEWISILLQANQDVKPGKWFSLILVCGEDFHGKAETTRQTIWRYCRSKKIKYVEAIRDGDNIRLQLKPSAKHDQSKTLSGR